MAQNDITTIDAADAAIAAEAATKGDLAALTPEQRTSLYGATCRSMGLNPLSQPFQYIRLNNKLTLYATRTATDQLRKINGVSITAIDKETFDGVLTVTVHARDRQGREDMEIGAVSTAGLKGEALANAQMKAITKAKRRVTLSISGLGWLDETEVDTIPGATTIRVDHLSGSVVNQETGEILPSIDAGDGRDRVNSALHAWGSEIGINHESIHFAAIELSKGKFKSLTELDERDLRKLQDTLKTAYIKSAPDFFDWLEGLSAKYSDPVEGPDDSSTAEQGELVTANVGGFDQ